MSSQLHYPVNHLHLLLLPEKMLQDETASPGCRALHQATFWKRVALLLQRHGMCMRDNTLEAGVWLPVPLGDVAPGFELQLRLGAALAVIRKAGSRPTCWQSFIPST